jgi:hypothetical protein
VTSREGVGKRPGKYMQVQIQPSRTARLLYHSNLDLQMTDRRLPRRRCFRSDPTASSVLASFSGNSTAQALSQAHAVELGRAQ